MKSSTSQKIKAGIFVAAGIVVLLLIIFFIGNQKNLFRSTIKLHANYRNVAGLQEGSFVRFAGINVGVVDLIEIKNDTTVRVEISIQKKVKQFLKTDSKASIANDGLMGDKLIQIIPGSDSGAMIADNGQLIAVNPFDMDKVMGKVDKVFSNIDTLTGNLASIFAKVNNGKGTLGKLINDDKVADDLQQTITSAKQTVKKANQAADGLNENMEAAKSNFLLKGYFKKKEKKRIADSTAKAKATQEKKEAKKN
jgi:phospholipid/cholesterol/gamma-HCH transport system substrate-binding protein